MGLWGRNSKSGLDCMYRVIWGCNYSSYLEGFLYRQEDFHICPYHLHIHTYHHHYHLLHQVQQSGLKTVNSMNSYLKSWLSLDRHILADTFSLHILFKLPFTHFSLSISLFQTYICTHMYAHIQIYWQKEQKYQNTCEERQYRIQKRQIRDAAWGSPSATVCFRKRSDIFWAFEYCWTGLKHKYGSIWEQSSHLCNISLLNLQNRVPTGEKSTWIVFKDYISSKPMVGREVLSF